MQSPLCNEDYALSGKLCPWAETYAQMVTIQVMCHANHIIWYLLMVL